MILIYNSLCLTLLVTIQTIKPSISTSFAHWVGVGVKAFHSPRGVCGSSADWYGAGLSTPTKQGSRPTQGSSLGGTEFSCLQFSCGRPGC